MLIQAPPAPIYPAHLPVAVQTAAPQQQPAAVPAAWVDRLQLSAVSQPLVALRPPGQLFAPQPVNSAGKVSLDLLSLNVYGLPKPLGKNITERSAVIGATLGRYDIAALQETFSKDTRAIGQTLALNDIKYQNHKPSHHRVIDSGLEIFSKYPIIARDFKPFKLGTDSDALAGKGVAFVRVEVHGIGPVDIYDTHYQANGDKSEPQPWYKKAAKKAASLVLPGFDKTHTEIRLHDNQIMAALIRKHDQGYPTFVMGDFNDNESSAVYRDLVQNLGLKDSFRELNPTAAGYTSDGVANPIKGGSSQKRIDFIFYRPGKDVDVTPVHSQVAYNQPGEFVSDHFGVHTRFELAKKP